MAEVVIIGLGYIGLPTSALIAKNKIKVHGVDISDYVVNTINSGKIHIVEPDLEQVVKETVQEGYLVASTLPVPSNTYIIVVPTPFKDNFAPDISFVQKAIEKIIPLLKAEDLIIIESTSPVGTTEKMLELINVKRPDLNNNVFLAYCPERVLPGNVLFELTHNDRVIGGIDQLSTEKAINFYSKFVSGKLHGTNSRTAEMCKLVENASRDTQIAFANELSMICDKAEINVWELIELANKHPRVNILKPGPGVGGHCIAVDPYFIVSDFPKEAQLISKSREINNYKKDWCIEKILGSIKDFEYKTNRKPKISCFGLAFKPNIDDLRESPANEIVYTLKTKLRDYDFYITEPNIKTHLDFKLENVENAVKKADIAILLVAHKNFKDLEFNQGTICLDFCGILEEY